MGKVAQKMSQNLVNLFHKVAGLQFRSYLKSKFLSKDNAEPKFCSRARRNNLHGKPKRVVFLVLKED